METTHDGRQVVRLDLHWRRSELVQMTEDGQRLATARFTNNPAELRWEIARAGSSRRCCWKRRTGGPGRQTSLALVKAWPPPAAGQQRTWTSPTARRRCAGRAPPTSSSGALALPGCCRGYSNQRRRPGPVRQGQAGGTRTLAGRTRPGAQALRSPVRSHCSVSSPPSGGAI